MTVYVADGITFSRQNDDSPQTYDVIPQVQSIGEIGVERALINVSNLSSLIHEFKKGLPEGTEFDVAIQYDPDNTLHAALKTDADSSDARSFRITMNNDSPAETHTFNAQVIRWLPNGIEIDSVLMLRAGFKITGSYVIA